jgi:hypothetical protein
MNYVGIDEVVSLARTFIGTSDKSDEPLFRQWTWEALQDVGISEDSIEVCTLKPKNLIARKPDNCKMLIDLALYDANGNQFYHVFRSGKKRIYADTLIPSNITSAVTGQSIPARVDVSDDRDSILLGTNGADVDAIVIRFFTYPIDKNGLPMIREDEKMAIVHFIRYAWAMRKNDNRSEIEQNRQAWMLESDRARARKKNITNEIMKSIVKRWSRLIADSNYTRF